MNGCILAWENTSRTFPVFLIGNGVQQKATRSTAIPATKKSHKETAEKDQGIHGIPLGEDGVRGVRNPGPAFFPFAAGARNVCQ